MKTANKFKRAEEFAGSACSSLCLSDKTEMSWFAFELDREN